MSLSAIAREVRFSEKETEEALRQLVACGTLIQKDDGCWAFPNFESWQETKDAARMRAHRERTTGVTVRVTVTPVVTPVSVLSTSVSSSSSSEEGVQREERTNPDDVGALWNDVCGRALPSISKLTDKRRAKVRSRCSEPGRDLAWWRAYFQRIADSPFLRGDVKAWCADFDWAVKDETTVAKVLEGAYDQRGTPIAPERENTTQFALRLAREERAREAARADAGQLLLAPGAER